MRTGKACTSRLLGPEAQLHYVIVDDPRRYGACCQGPRRFTGLIARAHDVGLLRSHGNVEELFAKLVSYRPFVMDCPHIASCAGASAQTVYSSGSKAF